MHVQLNANHIHSPPAEAAWILKRRAQSAGTAGGGLDCVGLVSPLSSRLGSAWWVHADSRRRAPCAPTPSPPSRLRLRGAARAQHPPRASQAPKFLEGRRWPQSRPHSLPPSVTRVPRSAQPQRRQHARRGPWRPGALLQRGQGPGAPRAATLPRGRPPLLLPGLRLRAYCGRAGPPLRVLLRQVRRGDRAGPCGREGPRGATCAALRTATACPPPHACLL